MEINMVNNYVYKSKFLVRGGNSQAVKQLPPDSVSVISIAAYGQPMHHFDMPKLFFTKQLWLISVAKLLGYAIYQLGQELHMDKLVTSLAKLYQYEMYNKYCMV
jgi:hypothetical protein